MAHDRRRILHFNVTAHPTAEWTGQQPREAFPFDQFPRYLLRDRDAIFGNDFRDQVRDMGIAEVPSTPGSPWQRAYVERVIGSIRRECLDHVIVLHESLLRRTLASHFDYYHRSRTQLSMGERLARTTPDSGARNRASRGGAPVLWASGAPVGLLPDAWNVRLIPHYSLGVWFVITHMGLGLRGVLLAHRVSQPLADRAAWVVGALGALFALTITVAQLNVHGGS